MRRLTTVVLVAVAVAGLSAMLPSSAFAVALPEFSVLTNMTATFGASTFETKNALVGALTSPKASAELILTGKQLGKVHLMFEGFKCTAPIVGTGPGESLGDAKEIVLALGEYHLVRLKSGDVGYWLLIEPVHIECLFTSTTRLLVIQGNLLALITPILTKTTKFELNLKQTKGAQEIKEFENDKGEKVKAKLETSVDEGEAAESGWQSLEAKITTEKETDIQKTT